MYQVSEISRFGIARALIFRGMLHCSIIFLLLSDASCGDHPHTTRPLSGDPVRITASESRTLNRGLPGEPQTLDPQLADDDFSLQVIRDLYEGLTGENSVGQIVPGVADSWEIDDSGTAYTFHLRPTARWSNGDRIVASEFVRGLQRAVDPHTASGSAALLGVIKGATDISAGHRKVTDLGVVAIDESTIRIELERPAPFITQILSQPIAAPFHKAAGANSSSLQQTKTIAVVNGPYEFTSRVPGAYIELT